MGASWTVASATSTFSATHPDAGQILLLSSARCECPEDRVRKAHISNLPQPARPASFIFSPPDQQMLETLSNRARKSKKKACCRQIPSAASVGSFGDSGIFAPRFRILWQPALSLFLLCKLLQRESPIRRVNHFMEAYNARQQISIVHLPSAIMPAAGDDHPRTSKVWFSPPR